MFVYRLIHKLWSEFDLITQCSRVKRVKNTHIILFRAEKKYHSNINLLCCQAKEDKDKPGLVAILQKVLQLYAACTLSKRSYAMKGMVLVYLRTDQDDSTGHLLLYSYSL